MNECPSSFESVEIFMVREVSLYRGGHVNVKSNRVKIWARKTDATVIFLSTACSTAVKDGSNMCEVVSANLLLVNKRSHAPESGQHFLLI